MGLGVLLFRLLTLHDFWHGLMEERIDRIDFVPDIHSARAVLCHHRSVWHNFRLLLILEGFRCRRLLLLCLELRAELLRGTG